MVSCFQHGFGLAVRLRLGRARTTAARVAAGSGEAGHASIVGEGHALADQHGLGPINPPATVVVLIGQQRAISLHDSPPGMSWSSAGVVIQASLSGRRARCRPRGRDYE